MTFVVEGRSHSTVILGLVPRIQLSAREKRADGRDAVQCRIQVEPVRVGVFDQVDLPGARVVLDGLLALDGRADVGEFLEPDERLHAITASECLAFAVAVLLYGFGQAVGYADIKRAAGLAGEDVGPVSAHGDGNSLDNQWAEYAGRWILGTSPRMTLGARLGRKGEG